MVEIVANLHAHTPYSDGHAYHHEIAQAAARAGIQVVVVTDHNVLVGGKEGYVDGVLLLVGEEIHDRRRQPQANTAWSSTSIRRCAVGRAIRSACWTR